jgi:hypothetical protein
MRNYLVHGQDFRAKLPKGFFVNEFVAETEELLRRSTRKLILH